MAPKRPLPSDTPGGGGRCQWARRLTLGHSFWVSFFQCFFRCLFLSLRMSFWRFWASILATLGGFFGAFSYLGSFLKIALPCGQELNNQGPGTLKLHTKLITNTLDCGIVLGSQFSKNLFNFGWKNTQKGTPHWTPKLAWCAGRTTYFHPWVSMVAQVVPNGAQSGSKGVQRVPKWS